MYSPALQPDLYFAKMVSSIGEVLNISFAFDVVVVVIATAIATAQELLRGVDRKGKLNFKT